VIHIAARYGGEEFVSILYGISPAEGEVAKRRREEVQAISYEQYSS
jgi:GGDEF domain-containing protein